MTDAGRPLGVAVVGAGYWGPNLARNFAAAPAWQLRWLVDLDASRARSVLGRYSTVSTSPDLAEALADPDVDAVAIATPPASHEALALAALDAGKHVLVEKPLAPTAAAASRLVERADEVGVTLMTDHTYCYTPVVARIRDLVSDGTLGDVLFFDSVRINLGLVQRDVDVLWDLAPHDLSILDHILPAGSGVAPVAVSAQGSDPIGAGVNCVAYLTVHLSNGALAHVHVNWLSPLKVRTTIIGGSQRTLVWDDLDPVQRLTIHDRGVDLARREDLPLEDRAAIQISYRTGDLVAPALPEREALRAMVEEFGAAIVARRPALTDGRAGLRVVQLLEAASQSMADGGRRVALDVAR